MSWTPFSLPQLPPGVTQFGSELEAATGAIAGLLTVVKSAAQLVASADISAISADQLALQAAVTALQAEINTLLVGTGVYMLMVPVRRKVIIPAATAAALAAAGLTSLPPGSADADVLKATALIGSGDFYSAVPTATGGNAGFLRTVIESLYDSGDANRPQFGARDYVTGAVMVAGATDYVQLANLAGRLSAIFMKNRPAEALDMPEIPTPQNLTARQVAGGVLLDWDATPPIAILKTLNVQAYTTQVMILRSTSPKFLSATSVVGVFGTATPAIGQTANDVTVVDIYDYSVATPITEYLDATEATGSCYYSVAYRETVGGEDLGFGRLSGIRKVRPLPSPPRTSKAKPPDWNRSPTLVSVIPDLEVPLKALQRELGQLASAGGDYKSLLNSYVQFIDQEIARFTTTSSAITGQINSLASLLSLGNTGGAYFHTYSGIGGVPFFIGDLGKALTGPDPSRPPFDKGDEFVMGFVIMAGAPSQAALAPVEALLSTIFGGSVKTETAVSRAVAAVQAGVDKSIAEITAALMASGFGTQVQRQSSQSLPLVGADDDGTNQNC